MKKEFIVSFGSNIPGSYDYVVVTAENREEAFRIGKSMLNTHKLTPDYLNKHG
jgi:hypothetical protein